MHPPCSRHDARPQGEAPPEASLQNTPTVYLRKKINDGRDAWRIIEARRRDRPDTYRDANDSDRFSAFTSNITDRS
jgi:hypothetical protein